MEQADTSEGKAQSQPATINMRAALGQILTYVRRYPGAALTILFLIFIDVIFATFLSLSPQFMIDNAIGPRNWSMLLVIIGGLCLGFCLVTISQIWRDSLYACLGARVLNDLRTDILDHLQMLSLGFFARSRLGDLLSRFSTDLGAVENAIVFGIATSVYALLHVAVSLAVLVALEWRLALIVIVGLPLCLIGPRIFGPRAVRAGYKFRTEQAALASTIEEQISAQPVIKAFGLRDMVKSGTRDQAARVVASASRSSFLSSIAERSPNIAMLALGILIIVGGGIMVFNDKLSVGALVSFNLLFVTVSTYVESFTASVPTLIQAAGGIQRINEIFAERPSIVEPPSPHSLPRLSQAIVFDGVSFDYGPRSRNLIDVSVQIPAGGKVAFVGPSGCGKSTIINLLMRFYDPQRGRILCDGIDLRDARLSTLYGQIGIVFQDNFLFNTSIRENIRLGRPDASDFDVDAAARAAELNEAAFGPLGYNTIVGERGGRLSGGQRQRVAIARALLRNPSILVLDEATASLDPPAAAAINSLLTRVTANRTVISVTHRLEDVIAFDRIYVMEGGRIVESGTHQELLGRYGAYAALWRGQKP